MDKDELAVVQNSVHEQLKSHNAYLEKIYGIKNGSSKKIVNDSHHHNRQHQLDFTNSKM